MKTKKAYVWVVFWPTMRRNDCITADLFFSSKEEFERCLNRPVTNEQLVEIDVPVEFDNWDYIPENY